MELHDAPTINSTPRPTAKIDGNAPLDGEPLLREALRRVFPKASMIDVMHITRRGGLARIKMESGEFVFKLITCRADWKKRYARWVGWNPARSAARMSDSLRTKGFDLCPVVEHGALSLPGAPKSVWTLSEYVPEVETIRVIRKKLATEAWAANALDQLFRDGLKLLRRIHDAGFEHRDYHVGNLLVKPFDTESLIEGEFRILLVDLETVCQRKATVTRRARDLRRYLENHIAADGDVSAAVRASVEIYAADDPALVNAILGTKRMKGLRPRA